MFCLLSKIIINNSNLQLLNNADNKSLFATTVKQINDKMNKNPLDNLFNNSTLAK